jgi:peptidoglycan/LPS O-acetylase OafA/YrhL
MKHNFSADGLRGMAALMVVVAHFLDAFVPKLNHKNFPQIFSENIDPSNLFKFFELPIFSVFYNGHFAVLIFFVLSGYVLTMPYFRNDIDALKARVWGRYFRLNFPIIAALLLAFIVLRLGGYYNMAAADISGSMHWLSQLVPTELTVSEFLKMAIYKSLLFGDHSLNTTLWTLKIEFIGSIYLLLFYLCCPKNNLKIATACVSLLLFAFYHQDALYYIAIFLGALINEIKKPKSKIFLLGIFLLGIYFGAYRSSDLLFNFLPTPLPSILYANILYHTVGAFFIVIAISNGLGQGFFQSRAAIFFGEISFPVYLLHPIILSSVASYLYIHLPRTNLNLLLIFLLYIIIIIGTAYIFEVYIDKNAVKFSHKFASYFLRARG